MTHKLNSTFIVDREHGHQGVSCTFGDGVDLETLICLPGFLLVVSVCLCILGNERKGARGGGVEGKKEVKQCTVAGDLL